jgi:hypothetical protein
MQMQSGELFESERRYARDVCIAILYSYLLDERTASRGTHKSASPHRRYQRRQPYNGARFVLCVADIEGEDVPVMVPSGEKPNTHPDTLGMFTMSL